MTDSTNTSRLTMKALDERLSKLEDTVGTLDAVSQALTRSFLKICEVSDNKFDATAKALVMLLGRIDGLHAQLGSSNTDDDEAEDGLTPIGTDAALMSLSIQDTGDDEADCMNLIEQMLSITAKMVEQGHITETQGNALSHAYYGNFDTIYFETFQPEPNDVDLETLMEGSITFNSPAEVVQTMHNIYAAGVKAISADLYSKFNSHRSMAFLFGGAGTGKDEGAGNGISIMTMDDEGSLVEVGGGEGKLDLATLLGLKPAGDGIEADDTSTEEDTAVVRSSRDKTV